MISQAVMCLCIGICTITDILKRIVYIRGLLIFSAALTVAGFIEKSLTIENFMAGICIGVGFMISSIISSGAIGMGDAWLYTIIICFMGFHKGIFIIFMSVLFAFFAALYLVIIKRKKKKYEMPLVPFMFMAYICCMVLWYGR